MWLKTFPIHIIHNLSKKLTMNRPAKFAEFAGLALTGIGRQA